jgi:hypothetical protein
MAHSARILLRAQPGPPRSGFVQQGVSSASFRATRTKPSSSAVRSNFGRFRRCYEGALSRKAALEAQLVVRLKLGADGKTTNVEKASGTLADSQMLSCALDAFKNTQLEARERPNTIIELPLLFAPPG